MTMSRFVSVDRHKIDMSPNLKVVNEKTPKFNPNATINVPQQQRNMQKTI